MGPMNDFIDKLFNGLSIIQFGHLQHKVRRPIPKFPGSAADHFSEVEGKHWLSFLNLAILRGARVQGRNVVGLSSKVQLLRASGVYKLA